MSLNELERCGQVVVVGFNEVKFCDFRHGIKAIATRSVEGSHVIVIYSRNAGILVHLSPPAESRLLDHSDERYREMIDNRFSQTIDDLLHQSRSLYHQHEREVPLPIPDDQAYSIHFVHKRESDPVIEYSDTMVKARVEATGWRLQHYRVTTTTAEREAETQQGGPGAPIVLDGRSSPPVVYCKGVPLPKFA